MPIMLTFHCHCRLLNSMKFWCCFLILLNEHLTAAFLFYPAGSSIGYLAAVAMPLDLPNRNVYMAFNFESNYGEPPNSSYIEWVERWNIDQNNFGIGNNVTPITSRRRRRYTRSAFYGSFIGYANHFSLNGSGCLLRTICEVTASQDLDEHNGLLGSIFKILFMPTTSMPESELNLLEEQIASTYLYEAELNGRNANCLKYMQQCPQGILDMISKWF